MNSLAYLSRQFDVLASAKTPPPTPTSDHQPFVGDRRGKEKGSESPLHRVSTWSTKSFLFPPPPSPRRSAPKRSFSSPSFTSLQQRGSTPPTASSSSPDLDLQTRSKPHVEHVIRRIFFIRVFALVWDNLRAAWLSLWRRVRSLEGPPTSLLVGAELPETEKRIAEDQTIDISPPIVSPASTATILPSDTKPEAQLAPLSSSASSTFALLLPSSESPASASRASTPVPARKTPFHLPKTLVLDLDETLIHSTSRPINSSSSGGTGLFGLGSSRNKGGSHMVEVVMGGRSTLYHVYKRPFVDFFLRTVSGWYTLVIFTASMQEYADPVIDWLDAGRGILAHRLFRDSCTQLPNGSFTKDLSIVEADLSRVCLVDNSPISYRVNEANGIPIEGWTHDPSDEALLDLLPVLDSLRFTSDVRRVLGLRSAGVFS
ncbi:Nuclear envelope morphology protein 1 [Hypsizygus marmoreus]|uniref:Nuclear envelope morphology protein 1 n=1 Tax=Hypsizygus marmoreus TaxID=39966 RepID=A0A369JKR5_HYPMA|nr:Nuclear envelope morphology protein 1 [Hypsizygus marmoreus]